MADRWTTYVPSLVQATTGWERIKLPLHYSPSEPTFVAILTGVLANGHLTRWLIPRDRIEWALINGGEPVVTAGFTLQYQEREGLLILQRAGVSGPVRIATPAKIVGAFVARTYETVSRIEGAAWAENQRRGGGHR